MVDRHSLVAQTAYYQLLSNLLDDKLSDIRGSAVLQKINGRSYWYDRYRVGTRLVDRFIGEDTPAIHERIAGHAELKRKSADRVKERARLVRLLRSERLMGADNASGSLISAMVRAGVFRLGGVLIGTFAFRQYQGELGLKIDFGDLASTDDIDIASFERLSLALNDHVESDLAQTFRDLQFDALPGLDNASTWRWKHSKNPIMVEFLTPSFSEAEEVRPLKALGVSAQSLHHLNFLISEPIDAALIYREGVLIKVPRPERYAIHKLIVADRRAGGPEGLKARKDMRQADVLIEVLAEDRPYDLKEAYEDALSRGPKWRERIGNTLRRAPTTAKLLQGLSLD